MYNLIAISCIVLMYSLDIIIAKRVFSPEIAGQYSFVSLIAKVIIFSNIAIAKAMFPMTSENFEKKKDTGALFKKALLFTGALSFVALLFYFLIPEFIVKILSLGDTRYLAASNVLFVLGIGFAALSFVNISILYKISLNQINKFRYDLVFFVILQITLLLIFNKSILEFSFAFTILNIIMLGYTYIIEKWKKYA